MGEGQEYTVEKQPTAPEKPKPQRESLIQRILGFFGF
jgi:hypothetical protein